MTLNAGTRLGPYEIIAPIGAGGMGEVYQARDPRLGRDVAIKVLPQALVTDPDRLRRFEQEARAVGALNHPNVLNVHDIGTQEGAPYIVSELLEGETLSERLRHGPLPVEAAISYAKQIAGGLAAAHRKGIVHRDLKPQNLFVDSDGHLKILDFGLAKLTQAEGPATAALTQTEFGLIVGTVGYMAPEQVRGQPADHRADIFALGAVLYEMISGQRAFQGDTPADTMSAILHAEPPELPSMEGNAAAGLDHLLRVCLDKDPNKRFQSAGDIVLALDTLGVVSGAPVRHHTATTLRRLWLITIAGVLIAGVTVAIWWMGKARVEPRTVDSNTAGRVVAVLAFKNISADSEQTYFTTGLTEEIHGRLSKIAALKLLSRSAVERYQPTDAQRMIEELGAGSIVEGSVRLDKQRVRVTVRLADARNAQTLWSEQYDRELQDIFAVQTEIALHIANALGATLSTDERQRVEKRPTENLAAYELYLQTWKLSQSDLEQNRKAIELLREAIRLDPRFALAQTWMAVRTSRIGYSHGEKYFDDALEMAREAVKMDPSLAEAHSAVATSYMVKGKAADARVAFLRALQLDPNHVNSMMNVSILEQEFGRYDESLIWAARALRLAPNAANAYYHVGVPLVTLGDHDVSSQWLGDAQRRFPTSSRITILLTMADSVRGNSQEALVRARKVAELKPKNEELKPLLAEMAFLAGAADAEQLAESLFQNAPDITAAYWLVPESPRVRLAYLLARRGARRHVELLDQAMQGAQKALQDGNTSPRVRIDIAAIHTLRGEKDKALSSLPQGYDAGWRDHWTLGKDPIFQSLRGEQALQALLERMESDVADMRRRVNIKETLPVPPPIRSTEAAGAAPKS